jgi:hypothetical protein
MRLCRKTAESHDEISAVFGFMGPFEASFYLYIFNWLQSLYHDFGEWVKMDDTDRFLSGTQFGNLHEVGRRHLEG